MRNRITVWGKAPPTEILSADYADSRRLKRVRQHGLKPILRNYVQDVFDFAICSRNRRMSSDSFTVELTKST